MAEEKKENEIVLQKSMTPVEVKGNRLIKHLPEIEALTEYAGDYVFYHLLSSQQAMGDILALRYQHALLPLFKQNSNKFDLGIHGSKYKVYSKTVSTEAVINDEQKKKKPVQGLFAYSRPILNVLPFRDNDFKPNVNEAVFTVGNVKEIAAIAWADALLMNNDRFALKQPGLKGIFKHPNIKNIMIYHPKNKPLVYVPIDQGFARMLTAFWYQWIEAKEDHILKKQKVKEGHKQLIFSKYYLYQKNSEYAATKWAEWYQVWVHQPDAKEFVKYNGGYFFPHFEQKQKNVNLAKAADIIETLWKLKGKAYCELIEKWVNTAEANLKQKLDIWQQMKNKEKWEIITKYINAQIAACKKIEPSQDQELTKRLIEIDVATKTNVLLKDFQFEQGHQAKQAGIDNYYYVSDNIDVYNDNNYSLYGNVITLEFIVITLLLMFIGFICGVLCGGFMGTMVERKTERTSNEENQP